MQNTSMLCQLQYAHIYQTIKDCDTEVHYNYTPRYPTG